MTAQIAVLGGGYAGVLAARRLAARIGSRGQVTLWSASDQFVERIRLHQLAAEQPVRTLGLPRLLGAATLRVARVIAIDVAARAVITDGGVVRPDLVVNALGSATARTIVGAEHALALDGPGAAQAVAAAARRAMAIGRPLAIVGGGLTAIELATELADRHRDLRIALVCRGAVGDGALGPAAMAYVERALAARGIAVHRGVVDAITPEAITIAGAPLAVAATVLCAGFVASPLAAAAGLACDRAGRMIVDEQLAVPGQAWLWGAGDAVVPDRPVGAPIHMACKTAMPMAAQVADNLAAVIAGAAPARFRFGDSGVCVSLGRRDGVIQRRDPAGANRGMIAGRRGAWIKEGVCGFTVAALRRPILQAVFRLYARRGAAALPLTARRALPSP